MLRVLNLLLIASFSLFACAKVSQEKPNVVLIVVDDMGWSDVGFMGSDYYETPNLDKLAAESMVFTNGYAGAANCAPSRAALISGMSAPHTGVYTVSPSTRGDVATRRLIPQPNTEFLDNDLYTIGDLFQEAGYTTGTFGKWHVGMDPLQQGFDVNVGGSKWGHPKSYFAPYIIPQLEAPEGEYLTERLTNHVIQFIDDNKENPFFVYLPYYTVHTPIQGKEELIAKYAKKAGSKGHKNPKYAAMVDAMDTNVGRILDKLEEAKLDKNTIVVFTSDNGGVYGITEQRPLRAGKGSYYEGGVRVPLTFKWQGKIAPGRNQTPAINLDFFPTFQEILGVEKIPHHLDGKSLWPLLSQAEALNERPIIFHFPVYLQGNHSSALATRGPLFRCRPGTSIRYGDWKLLRYYEDDSIELFDLKEDVSETNNVAEQYPEKAKELIAMMNNWLQKKNAPIPSALNPKYNTDFEAAQSEKALNKVKKNK